MLCVSAVLGCEARQEQSGGELTTDSSPAPAPSRLPAEHWASRLDDGSPEVRREALANLGGYGREAAEFAPSIVSLLADPDAKTGFTAAWALAQIGMAAHPLLIQRLESSSAEVRERAAYGVGETGPAGAAGTERLRQMMEDDPSPSVRSMAAWALGQVEGRRMIADPNMMLLEGVHGNQSERYEAIRRLGVTATTSRIAIRELIALLGDSLPGVRMHAIDALAEIGPAALPSLSAALSHRNRRIRSGALLAISRMQRVF